MAKRVRVAVRTEAGVEDGGARYQAALSYLRAHADRVAAEIEALANFATSTRAYIAELIQGHADDLEQAEAEAASMRAELRAELDRATKLAQGQLAQAQAETTRERERAETLSREWAAKFEGQGKDWQAKLEKEIAAGAAKLQRAEDLHGSALAELRNRHTQELAASGSRYEKLAEEAASYKAERDKYRAKCERAFEELSTPRRVPVPIVEDED